MSKKVFIFACELCGQEIGHTAFSLKRICTTMKCRKCVNRDRPFIRAFNRLKQYYNKIDPNIVNLTYEEFLEFTKQESCHYCLNKLEWIPYGPHCYKSNLDRKDCNGPYSVNNCVACCWKCNAAKGNSFSYEEWYGMTDFFRKNYNKHKALEK